MFTTELVSLKNKILLPSRVGDTGFVCTCHRWESHSIYLDDVSFRMRYEFRCVQALEVPWGRRSKKKFSETSIGDW